MTQQDVLIRNTKCRGAFAISAGRKVICRCRLWDRKELARHFCSDAELQSVLLGLKADIETGAVQSVIHQYENDLGDYCFILAEKMVNCFEVKD